MHIKSLIWLPAFSCLLAAEPAGTAEANAEAKSENPLSVEIISISRQYLNRKNHNSAQITLKTDATALYELRSGLNCRTSHSLSESKYHGVAKAGENSVVAVESADLKDGYNNLVLCFNKEILVNSSSRNLDYKTNVYDRNVFLIVDNTPPEVTGFFNAESESKKTIHLSCSDSHGCEKIFYAYDKENAKDGFTFEGQSLALNLKGDESQPKTIALSAQDRAGNVSETKTITLNNENDSPYGRGRFSILPAYYFRLDGRKDKIPGGASIVLAADFGVHHWLKTDHRPWLPGLRVEGSLATLRGGDNTADVTGLYLGPVWLIPLTTSRKLALALGTTWGVAKSLSIYADNTTVSATALSGNMFAGVEYAWKGLFFSVQARMVYVASGLDMLLAAGGGLGVGMRF